MKQFKDIAEPAINFGKGRLVIPLDVLEEKSPINVIRNDLYRVDKPCLSIQLDVNNIPLASSSIEEDELSIKAIAMAITELESIKLKLLDRYSPDIEVIKSDDL